MAATEGDGGKHVEIAPNVAGSRVRCVQVFVDFQQYCAPMGGYREVYVGIFRFALDVAAVKRNVFLILECDVCCLERLVNLQFFGFRERLWLVAVKGSHVSAQAFGVAKSMPEQRAM